LGLLTSEGINDGSEKNDYDKSRFSGN